MAGMTGVPEAVLRRIFRVSLYLKGAHSLLEVLGGLALEFVAHDVVVRLATALIRAELLEDPQDFVAGALRRAVDGFSPDAQSFAAYYLLGHGLIKLVLVGAVLTNRVWAYPAFIAAMLGFIAYQAAKMSQEVTVFLAAVTVLDMIVLVLAWHEYRLVRRQGRRATYGGYRGR